MSIEAIKSFLTDPTRVIKLESIQSYKNISVVPLVTRNNHIIEFETLLNGEKGGFAFIQEQESESVSQLEAVNNGTVPILIPFMQTIKGGKQDRTVFEPILVPASISEKLVFEIPSKCVEQSRWGYRNEVRRAARDVQKKFSSSRMKVSPSSSRRTLGAKYHGLSEQGEMWSSLSSLRTQMNIGGNVARSNSHLEMMKSKEKEIKNYAKEFKLIPGQTGAALFINGILIGMELYGNDSFKDFFEDIINAFALEALIRKTKENFKGISEQDAQNQVLSQFNINNIEFTTRKGVGLGDIVEFKTNDMKWVGISLVHDGKLVHFYMVAETALNKNNNRTRRTSQVRTSGLNRGLIR